MCWSFILEIFVSLSQYYLTLIPYSPHTYVIFIFEECMGKDFASRNKRPHGWFEISR